jgi:hypothetical protein
VNSKMEQANETPYFISDMPMSTENNRSSFLGYFDNFLASQVKRHHPDFNPIVESSASSTTSHSSHSGEDASIQVQRFTPWTTQSRQSSGQFSMTGSPLSSVPVSIAIEIGNESRANDFYYYSKHLPCLKTVTPMIQ